MANDETSLDRRGFLKYAATGAVAAVPNSMHAQEHDHDHDHDHQVVPSDPALRTKALKGACRNSYCSRCAPSGRSAGALAGD